MEKMTDLIKPVMWFECCLCGEANGYSTTIEKCAEILTENGWEVGTNAIGKPGLICPDCL